MTKAIVPHSVQQSVAMSKEVDGIDMGVLDDGTTYLSARGLARLCGVAPSAVITQGARWAAGDRDSKLAQMLTSLGYDRPVLYIEIPSVHTGTGKLHAYPDDVCMAVLEYYAFEVPNPGLNAASNFRKLARAGLRTFVYTALGYDPAKRVPQAWRQFHDRLQMHSVPKGYFSVFRECSDFVLSAIRGGLIVNEHTIPDISVGQGWGKHWEENKLEMKFGPRTRHDHNYPDYFPQALSNPQPIWVYPVDALGAFRKWMDSTYLPQKFPKYLDGKVSRGQLSPSTAELLLLEVAPEALIPEGALPLLEGVK